jgi:hypothetical protein
MRVLIGFEFSGVVRDAFSALGHDAWSCDLLPSERPGNHFRCDVREVLNEGWDLAIFHPPCTYLANSGVRWLYGGKGNVVDAARWRKMEEAAEFFGLLLDAPVPMLAVENPVMHGHAQRIIGVRHSQVVQPFEHGHGETKATCLWLKNLSLLVPTQIVEGRAPRVHHESPGPDRWKNRSRTLEGIAAAMANAWGGVAQPVECAA